MKLAFWKQKEKIEEKIERIVEERLAARESMQRRTSNLFGKKITPPISLSKHRAKGIDHEIVMELTKNGLTGHEIAKKIGCSPQRISQIRAEEKSKEKKVNVPGFLLPQPRIEENDGERKCPKCKSKLWRDYCFHCEDYFTSPAPTLPSAPVRYINDDPIYCDSKSGVVTTEKPDKQRYGA